jgi:hypothetical protein
VAIKQQLEAEGLARKVAGGRIGAAMTNSGRDMANLPEPDDEPWTARAEAARLVNISPRSVHDAGATLPSRGDRPSTC